MTAPREPHSGESITTESTAAHAVSENASGQPPVVGVIMGSRSDWETMRGTAELLEKFGVPFECRVVSAHRTPHWMVEYATSASERGLKVIIAAAGGAAHLPGMVASMTPIPVIGVPILLANLSGLDSLLSIVQMPSGVPVATVGIDQARNAGILALRILAVSEPTIREFVDQLVEIQTQASLSKFLT